ncbi:MAG: hypothetical protein KJ955_05205 [Nanoarchaeota archaeon]|nr:hypothetical protein [Nanoarchaeota archaeon]
MLEKLLELDEKGIIAKPHWNEARYLDEGNAILEAARKLVVTDEYSRGFRAKHGVLINNRGVVPWQIAEMLQKDFRTNVAWMPVFYSDNLFGDSGWAVDTDNINGMRSVPAVVIFGGGSSMTIHHECIHLMRNFVNYGMHKEFEETFANYLNVHNYTALLPFDKYSNERAICRARDRLDEAVGMWAGYALARLTPPEVRRIGSARNPFMHLKGMNGLRHRIIKERIGL